MKVFRKGSFWCVVQYLLMCCIEVCAERVVRPRDSRPLNCQILCDPDVIKDDVTNIFKDPLKRKFPKVTA